MTKKVYITGVEIGDDDPSSLPHSLPTHFVVQLSFLSLLERSKLKGFKGLLFFVQECLLGLIGRNRSAAIAIKPLGMHKLLGLWHLSIGRNGLHLCIEKSFFVDPDWEIRNPYDALAKIISQELIIV